MLQRGYDGQVSAIQHAETSAAPMTFLFYADPMVERPSDPKGYTTALPPAQIKSDLAVARLLRRGAHPIGRRR